MFSKKKKLISILLSLTMVFSMVSAMTIPASADLESQIAALQAKREEINAQKIQQQETVDMLIGEQADILEQKAALDEKSAYTQEQIQLTQEEIEMYNQLIAEKEVELQEALRVEAEQLERYRVRVRAMEESGGYNILAFILQAENLGELLATIDDVGEIMESDRELEDAYIEARENTAAVKVEYEEYQADLEEKQEQLEAEQAELEQEIEEASELIMQYEVYIADNEDVLDEIKAAVADADAQINDLVAQLEAQRKKEAEAAAAAAAAANASSGGGSSSSGSGYVTGSGSYMWPVSCTYITSCVGYRYHPVTGKWKYHSGMDIGASYGSTIWAADSGTVVIAGENGGYGNCVMIDHNNGYYTLYGHMSSIAVSEGQAVSKGDTIGYVGSTGVSTGPHLHFEIREGNTCLDFSSWFSGLTYDADSGG